MALQLHVFEGRHERIPGDESDPRFLDPRSNAAQSPDLPDRREHRLVMDRLLDSLELRRAPLGVQLGRLFPDEPLDIGIASISVRTARGYKGFDSCGCVA